MARVLLVGSHPEITRYVADRLRAEGWEVEDVVGPEAGLRAIDQLPEVDALIVGGPDAWQARGQLTARLRARHPYAPVVYPTSPDGIGDQLRQAFGGDAQ